MTKLKKWLQSQNVRRAYIALMVLALSAPAFAQSDSTINIDIDLSTFWSGFNQFFIALSGPLFFIAAIPAALGFITMIAMWLRRSFTSGSA